MIYIQNSVENQNASIAFIKVKIKFTQLGGRFKTFVSVLVAGMRDDEAAANIQLEPLSDGTIQRIIRPCIAKVLGGLVRCLKSSQYSQFS
jgi:hypothetical protein